MVQSFIVYQKIELNQFMKCCLDRKLFYFHDTRKSEGVSSLLFLCRIINSCFAVGNLES